MLTIDNVPGHRLAADDGARPMPPAVAAYVPFGLLVGAHVATSPDPLVAWLGTFTIYGGAAQLALLDVLAAGGSVVAAAVTALLLQARLAVVRRRAGSGLEGRATADAPPRGRDPHRRPVGDLAGPCHVKRATWRRVAASTSAPP